MGKPTGKHPNRNLFTAGVSVMLMIVSQMAWADYMVTSEVTGNDCWGIGIKICNTVKVVAFKKGGEFYEMPTSFSTVSTYSEDNGRCSINIDTGIWTPLKALTTATLPSFYTKKDGKLKEITPDYLLFNCKKTP